MFVKTQMFLKHFSSLLEKFLIKLCQNYFAPSFRIASRQINVIVYGCMFDLLGTLVLASLLKYFAIFGMEK